MKRTILSHTLALGLLAALAIGGAGCKHSPKGLTPIPSSRGAIPNPPPEQFLPSRPLNNIGSAPPVNIPPGNVTGIDQPLPDEQGNIRLSDLEKFADRPANREVFKAYTVYFDFDQSVIKSSERPKLEAVADFLKKAPADNDLVIEGHCDQRGTEEYNRALGERRALSIREYLVNLGLGANRIQTISYGEDRPAVPEENEAAYAQNRRGEFLLLLPKQP